MERAKVSIFNCAVFCLYLCSITIDLPVHDFINDTMTFSFIFIHCRGVYFLLFKLQMFYLLMFAVSDWPCSVGLGKVNILTETENFLLSHFSAFLSLLHLPSPLHDFLFNCEEEF